MQTIRIKPSSSEPPLPGGAGRPRQGPEGKLTPLLAGVAAVVATTGALLALADADSPLRGAFTLFFLLAAPGLAVWVALRGLGPPGRAVASIAGAVALNLLVAQGMLATHSWSVRGGVVAVAATSSLVLLPTLVRRLRGLTERRRTS